MQVQGVNAIKCVNNTNFRSVKNVFCPNYCKNLTKYNQNLNQRIKSIETMDTDIYKLLDYSELTGLDKIYADEILKRLPKDEENLTVDIYLSENKQRTKSGIYYGYLTVDFPILSKKMDRTLYSGHENRVHDTTIFLIDNDKEYTDKDADVAFLFGKLPIPGPLFIKERIKACLLDEGKNYHNQNRTNPIKFNYVWKRNLLH